MVDLEKFKKFYEIEELVYGRADAKKRFTARFMDKQGVSNTLYVGQKTDLKKPLFVVVNDGKMEGKEYLKDTLWVVNSNWKQVGVI